jgi:hypothetical protein
LKTLIALVLALLAAGASAQTTDPSEANDGDFGAKLVITDDAASFYSQWQQPRTPQIFSTKQITRARPIEAVIIFHDCVPAADGNCNVTVHFEMTAPNGQPYPGSLDTVAWKHPPPPGHALIPSEATMGFILEPKDQLGRYIIRATLTDTVAGKTLSLVESVTAVEEASPRPTPRN